MIKCKHSADIPIHNTQINVKGNCTMRVTVYYCFRTHCTDVPVHTVIIIIIIIIITGWFRKITRLLEYCKNKTGQASYCAIFVTHNIIHLLRVIVNSFCINTTICVYMLQ